ncbi:phosphopantetheine-binding protein [Rhodobacteraceae bacterium]|nr:phosphopantetheine-binding protein [Paracoccaceae bacterium]
MTSETENWTADRVVEVMRTLAKEDDLPAHLISGEITGKDTVETLGIDSLGGAYLIERLEDTTGVQMPDDFLDLTDDIDKIALRLNNLIKSAG